MSIESKTPAGPTKQEILQRLNRAEELVKKSARVIRSTATYRVGQAKREANEHIIGVTKTATSF